ncbi:signal recognition particle subunit SRP54 [Puccinia graminis f. sp. tritici CRL 75-36-700-3]|uniref:signal-recognition-particle GTPase n=1 Tax=Puccinia graminis f. sp. tritici (strain CRL 75-36-700-3 / race SCCL) TaxID=418459 RepID=E3K5I3_PUCGT|nr:signal recognition particle subunit SRP54 [Puccinia graminis f. sp. tritici CRL 75-36-700-3]EFP79759.1 signal recognition particle subunit SRP54 [Puccinia graminis f. sp. tritici CRL 75-36-700-3]
MVLADLGKKINAAFSELQRTPLIDDKALDLLLKGISAALLSSDVNVTLVANLRNRVKSKLSPQLEKLIQSPAKQKQLVHKTVFDELVALVSPTGSASDHASSSSRTTEYTPWQPKKGKPNVIMFVGLQGSGKTTSCTKLAVYYRRKGFKTALVCADTFRAGAFDQLKQNATKAKIPFYGSHTETDPIAISTAGVTRFKRERFEVIIVDTSGRHRQETELFEEMKQISAGVTPNLTIMVLDGAIGQAAEAQTRAFKEAADFGAIIVTKMDGHAKGGGAISAVAAAQTPIMFIGTGEHLHDLERFAPEPFISKLLGMGDIGEFLETMQDLQSATPSQNREEMRQRIERGVFTIRDLRDQMSNLTQMGSISKIASMIPGMSNMMAGLGGDGDEMSQKMKRMVFIFDAMSPQELDSDGSIFRKKRRTGDNTRQLADGEPREPHPRVLRIARGSGTSVDEVEGMLAQHAMFATMVKGAGGKRKWEQQQALKQAQQQSKAMMGGSRGGKVKQQQVTIEQLVKMAPAQRSQVLRQAPASVRKQIEDAGGVDAFYALSQAAQRTGGQPSAAARARRAAAAMGGAGGGAGGGGLGSLLGGLGGLGGLAGGQMPDPEVMRKMMEQMGMGDLGSMFGAGGPGPGNY